MSIWAEIKKSINSNLNKPLNITLDEIKGSVDKVGKVTRIVKGVKGATKNDTYSQQVLTLNDEALLSIEGSGRILQILPVAYLSGSMSRNGTGLLTVDDKVIFNNYVTYAFPTSDKQGYPIVNNANYTSNMSVSADILGALGTFYFINTQQLRDDCSTFISSAGGIFAPNGIPFKNKFEIRLTQTMTTDIEKVGVLVVYELYE